jgi:hypothetical protein
MEPQSLAGMENDKIHFKVKLVVQNLCIPSPFWSLCRLYQEQRQPRLMSSQRVHEIPDDPLLIVNLCGVFVVCTDSDHHTYFL